MIVLSIASYFLVLFVENLKFLAFDSVVGIFVPTMQHPMTWLSLFLVAWVNYALDKIFELIGDYYDSRED